MSPRFHRRYPLSWLVAAALSFGVIVGAAGQSPRPAAGVGAAVRPADFTRAVRVACVGDSITAGSGTRLPPLDSYPAQLQRMLDPEKWEVRNFGVSGATLMSSGDKPYREQKVFNDALKFEPDVVIIMLGTNDTKPQNWAHREEFSRDYRALIAAFRDGARTPRIFLCRPVVVAGEGRYGINEAGIDAEMPLIDALAEELGVAVIDQHATLAGHEDLIPDTVHPNTAGANRLARTVHRSLTGSDFAGELAPVLHGTWNGFPRIDFEANGRAGFVVMPKTPAAGRPWIWRPEFFETEPQTEIALLDRGWHAAYVDVRNLYGAPVALDAMDAFYEKVTTTHRLSSKVVLAGFSRGGLFAVNWAVRHPERIACLYLDAPVLDFKSWPAGRGKGVGSPADWRRLLAVYGLTEEEALAYPSNPIDSLEPLAAAGVPILSVCGDSDRTVPFEENTAIAKERYDALGGTMQVILKPGVDHHPHSLADPTPIVDFILAHPPGASRASLAR